tara:strand:+ start:2607 stop:4406 length:1800 start_codon:yes stop_codon:yes gene_type:complete
MATAITKTIGSTGRQYANMQLFEDALPANLVTSDETWTGECYNDSEFTSAVIFSGSTTDATRFVTLTTATDEGGQSFLDHADAATNPLNYDQSKGVGLHLSTGYDACIKNSVPYLVVENLQLRRTNSSAAAARVIEAQTNIVQNFNNCIMVGEQTGKESVRLGGSSSTISNCLVIHHHTAKDGIQLHFSANAINCTSVSPSDVTSSGVGIGSNYASPIAKNCASFGFGTDFDSGWAAGADYNASDSTGSPGANSVDSLTYADQFENTTAASGDFRAKTGHGFQVGIADLSLDIVGQTRADPPTIGAWEFVEAAAAAFHTFELPKLAHPDFSVPNRKPVGPVEIDTGHWAGNSPKMALVFNDAASPNIIGTLRLSSTVVGSILHETKAGERSLRFVKSSTDAYDYSYDEATSRTEELTISLRYHDDNTGNFYVMWAGVDGDNTATSSQYQLRLSGGSMIMSILSGSSAVSTTMTPPASGFHTYTWTYKTGGLLAAYYDGVFQSSASAHVGSLNVSASASRVFRLGNRANSSDAADCWLSDFQVFDQEFNAAAVASLHQNRYQFLKPQIPLTYFFAAEEVAAAFKAYWARNSNTIIQQVTR